MSTASMGQSEEAMAAALLAPLVEAVSQSEEAGAAALLAPLVEAVGEGLFPSVARLNHSCAPNCALSIDAYGCCVVRVRGRR